MLFKTIDQFQEFIPVNASLTLDLVESSIKTAESRWLRNILGKALFEKLQADFNADVSDAKHLALLEASQKAVALLGFHLYAPFAQVQISDAGFQTLEDDRRKPARKWQVDSIRETAKFEGFQALEDLLEFLEENEADYPLWDFAGSHGYTINSARQFSEEIHINDSRLIYLKLIPHIKRAERSLRAVVSPGEFDFLMERLADRFLGLTPEQERLMDYIRPTVAHTAYSSAIPSLPLSVEGDIMYVYHNEFMQDNPPRTTPSEGIIASLARTHREEAEKRRKELSDFLQENADNYPLFKVSSAFVQPAEEVDEDLPFEDGTGFFMA